jgi:hypothetical protein
MFTTIIRERDFTLVCVKNDGASPVTSQPPSVKSLSLMVVVYMPPKHVGVKVAA